MCFIFFFNDTATTEIYTLSLHDALPIWRCRGGGRVHRRPCRRRRGRCPPARSARPCDAPSTRPRPRRSDEHTSELQSRQYIVCRLLLEKKKINSCLRPTSSINPPKTSYL